MAYAHIIFPQYPNISVPQAVEEYVDNLFPSFVKLKTCQRFEYFVSQQENPSAISTLVHYLNEHGLAFDLFDDSAEICSHLFHVCCGLSSTVLGETEIQGQIKSAYVKAIENGTVNSLLHGLFQKALFVGKKVRTETSISEGGLSYAGAGFKAIKEFSDSFVQYPSIGIVGSGTIAQELHMILRKNRYGVSHIYTKNIQRAARLFEDSNIFSYENLHDHLLDLDIIVCATQTKEPLLSYQHVSTLSSQYKKPQICIDFGSPANIEAAVSQLPMIALVNLSQLSDSINQVSEARKKAVDEAKLIVKEEVVEHLSKKRVLKP